MAAPSPIRVLVVDDHPMMRAGIVGEVDAEAGMQVVGEAGDGLEAIELFKTLQPNIVLVDLRLPNLGGMEAIRTIRALCSTVGIIVLTSAFGDVHVYRAFRAGASGYLTKSMVRKELINTIRVVHSGRRRIPEDIAMKLADYSSENDLSNREVEVLKSAARGLSNKRIADEMHLSEHTIKGHIKCILSKLHANDRTHAVTISLRRGFFEL